MKLKLSDKIYLPIEYMPHLNIQKYFYLSKQGKTVSSASINEKFVELPRNKRKFLDNFALKDVEFDEFFVEEKFSNDFVMDKNFVPRPQQEEIVQKILENVTKGNNDLIIEMQTGGGKTAMLPYLLSKLQTKTLILVDMKLLADQMVEAFELFTTKCDYQVIDKNFKEVKDVNIATLQFLNRHPEIVEQLREHIGLVILDEAHIVAAETIKTIVQQFPSKYRIGLSATPSRSDGLDGILHDIFPTKITTIAEAVVPIELITILCEHTAYGDSYREVVKKLIFNFYLEYIIKIVEYLVKKDKSIMIAVDDIDIQNMLVKLFEHYGSAAINSKIPKKERDKILQDYDDGKIKVLVGYKVLGKGINIPRIEVLINLFAATTKENLEQLIGRLNRQHKDKKKAYYIEFVLSNMFHRQYMTKMSTLKYIAEKMNISFKKITLDRFLEKLK